VGEIPTREMTDSVIIKFLEENIISIFGCPGKIITNNSQAFKSFKLFKYFKSSHDETIAI
jgi:hypothetical protein